MTNRKNGAYTQDLNLAEMKAICKLKNCTLNDYIMSVYSNTLYEFFDQEKHKWNDKIPTKINIAMPISLRQTAKLLKDVRMSNHFIAFPLKIAVKKDFDEALKVLKPMFSSLKRSLRPFGALMAFQIVANLPFLFPRYTLMFFTSKYHMFFTNLRAAKKAWVWNKKK